MPLFEPGPAGWLMIFLSVYILMQRILRNWRLRSLERRYAAVKENLGSMTDADAQQIQRDIADFEFPGLFELSLQFALFRTYGIPSIARLLVKTKQFATDRYAPKRLADTGVLIQEIYYHPPTDQRAREALGRLNYIHGVYRNASQISNDDMLYTLGMFAWEPIRWIDRYGWRKLTALEKCAIGTFVKSWGDAMEISYEVLPSSKGGWQNGLHWLDEFAEWLEEYEKEFMVPDQACYDTAERTTSLFLQSLPASFRSMGRKILLALLDDRLRISLMYEQPPEHYIPRVRLYFSVRKFFSRYIALPRFSRLVNLSDKPSPSGRLHLKYYGAHPFYVKPTILNRWGFEAWMNWAIGIPLPGDGGGLYHPEGYKIDEVGPEGFLGKGAKESQKTQERLLKERTGGCPFAKFGK